MYTRYNGSSKKKRLFTGLRISMNSGRAVIPFNSAYKRIEKYTHTEGDWRNAWGLRCQNFLRKMAFEHNP